MIISREATDLQPALTRWSYREGAFFSHGNLCVFLRCSDRFSKVRSPHLLPAGSESTVMPGAPSGSAAACWSSSDSTEAKRRKDAFVLMRRHSGGGVTLIYQHTPRQERESGPSPCGYRCSGLPPGGGKCGWISSISEGSGCWIDQHTVSGDLADWFSFCNRHVYYETWLNDL